MSQNISDGPPAVIIRFFSALAENDRIWLALLCAYNIEDKIVKTAADADAWLTEFLTSPRRPRVRFSRLIYLVAFLDFELSPPAISRFAARATWMTQSDHASIADQGRQMLADMVPRMIATQATWQDIRSNELDEAALWVFRDESDQRDLAELPTRITL